MDDDRYDRWYSENIILYEELKLKIENAIEKILFSEGFDKGKHYVIVDSRVKTSESFIKKMMKIENGKRRYGNPTQITDLVGFRIVCYLLSDVQKIKSVIEHHFKIDWGNTKYPQDKLKENEIGYRSTNYIVKLSDHLLDEEKDNEKFKELSFEIQVKTLLDFAWQEIQHDRVYKTTIKYPKGEGIERKFILLSGLLEIADNEFDESIKRHRQI